MGKENFKIYTPNQKESVQTYYLMQPEAEEVEVKNFHVNNGTSIIRFSYAIFHQISPFLARVFIFSYDIFSIDYL